MARRESSLVGMMNLKFVLKIAVQKPIRPRCRLRVHHWAALVRPLQQSYSGGQFDDTTREQFGHSVNNHNIPTDNLMARRASSLVGMMNLKFVLKVAVQKPRLCVHHWAALVRPLQQSYSG